MIAQAKCYTYIFHGEQDSEVPICHGKLLASKTKNLFEGWWVDGGHHNDIDCKFRKTYFIKISKFLRFLKDFKDKQGAKDFESFSTIPNWFANSDHIYYTKYLRKASNKKTKSIDSSSFTSNASFLISQNTTSLTKPDKISTDSVMTLGQETARKNVETARSAELFDEGIIL